MEENWHLQTKGRTAHTASLPHPVHINTYMQTLTHLHTYRLCGALTVSHIYAQKKPARTDMHREEGMNIYSSQNFCLHSWINACWWEKVFATCVTPGSADWHPFTAENLPCLFFDPSVLDFAVQIASEACGLYAGRLIGRWGRNISHLSCLRDKAVCQSSHINNVTGRNVPGLWRSHGSLLIPFDWGNDLHCWTQRDDISLAAFRQSKEIRQPLTPTPLQLHLSSDHPPHISLCIFLFCLFCLHDIFLERKSAAVLSRRWIR